jgi:hypothetical protein
MKLTLEDGKVVEVGFRKLKIAEFPRAFAAFKAGDEIRLIAMTMVPEDPNSPMPGALVLQLSQASYNDAAIQMRTENKDFFGSCVRLAIDAMTTDASALSRTAAEFSRNGFGLVGGPTSPNSPSLQG